MTPNGGKDVEKLDHVYSADGNIKYYTLENFSSGMDIYTLPNEKQIASGKQPHSTGRSAQCFVPTKRGGIGRGGGRETQEGRDMGTYV